MSEPIEHSAEGLWASLRRRKVAQWGIVTMALLVGLPIALVLAWYHGDRGHQKVSGREFAILTVDYH